MLILSLFVAFNAPIWELWILVVIVTAIRDTVLVIKYKHGILKLSNDKDPFNFSKRNDLEEVLDYIKRYEPECVHIVID